MAKTASSSCCDVVVIACLLFACAGLVRSVVEIGPLVRNIQHGVSGTLEIISTTSMRIRDFTYDGQGPAAYLYTYRPGTTVTSNRFAAAGDFIRLPPPAGDDMGALLPGRRYSGEDFTFDLPAGKDVCDISTFTIWCEQFGVFFARIDLPASNFVDNGADPCRIVGSVVATTTVAPTDAPTDAFTGEEITDNSTTVTTPTTATTDGSTVGPPAPGGHENCIPLDNSLQLSWTVYEPNQQISFMLCGCQSSDASILQYMGFGLSGSTSRTFMEGADVTIAWIGDAQPNAVDYHLRSGNRVQCRAGLGVCPDTLDSRGTCSNNVKVTGGLSINREQCVSFIRNFTTADEDCDLPIDPANTEQYIVWGVGPLEETAFRHFTRSGTGTPPLHLGRAPLNQCNNVPITCQGCAPFSALPSAPMDGPSGPVFEAKIGPSGSDRGYMALTGQASWGIAWYINGVLAPELFVERGTNYTFIVEGGDDPNDLSNYHPFYITDSVSGGRLQNTGQQQMEERLFAGFDENDVENAFGRLCSLLETDESASIREQCGSLEAYLGTLSLTCGGGQPGTLVWTPDESTPDVVYYQCATHRNLGWRINVRDPQVFTTVQSTMNTTDESVGSSLPVLTLSLSAILGFSLAGMFLAQQ